SDWTPTGQPNGGRWFWRDTNGNGKFDPGEYTPTDGPTGEYWASSVDVRGDIWQAGRESGIWRWTFTGLDAKGNPKYDPKPDHWTMPEPFVDLLRTEYDPATDRMILTGATKERPISGGEWGTAGTVAARYESWSKKPVQKYRIDFPYTAEKEFVVSVHAAGELLFAVDCKQANVRVYAAATGEHLGTMKPGPEVSGQSGWVDFCDAIRATRLTNGGYLVFVEEDWKAKVIVYHLDDPLKQPTPKPADLAGHKLLVTSVRTGDTEVFVVDPGTGDATNLSRSPKSEDRYPCWSPDGKRVAFTSNRDGPYSLYVMDADGKNVTRLIDTKATCYMPSWQTTAAGERIVFGMHGGKAEMASVKPDGTALKMLGGGHDPTLSPDGKQICYTGDVDGGVAVFVMDANGENKTRVVKETSKVGATFPNWSPDGKRIVYSYPVGDALELFVANADGSDNRQLTKLSKVCTPAAWSPDGRWISFRFTDERYWSDPKKMEKVYAEKPGDKRPVWVIRPDGTDAGVVECLRYQCAMDGSRAAWKPK
ncbi:MAG: hypothetical protein K2V38_15360, partial [Gemmataceae bacterium]|nr:hypothetical protein [Gemmataceae bacterium]